MPEIKEVPYLKADDIKEAETLTVTFLSPHEEVSAEESGLDKEISQILVELPNGGKRIWTMNKTSQRIIVGLHGNNSDQWVGKKVKIYYLKQMVNKQERNVIYTKGERVE